jgi:hypothetical protein
LDAPRGGNLDDVLAESVKHGFSEDESQKVKAMILKNFSTPAGYVAFS